MNAQSIQDATVGIVRVAGSGGEPLSIPPYRTTSCILTPTHQRSIRSETNLVQFEYHLEIAKQRFVFGEMWLVQLDLGIIDNKSLHVLFW